MKKNIFILTACLISICADAQINPKLRSIIYDQRPYGFYERDFDAKGIRIYAGGPIYHKADFTNSFTKERYEEAEQRLKARKVDFRKNKGLVDMESACVILEQYLRK